MKQENDNHTQTKKNAESKRIRKTGEHTIREENLSIYILLDEKVRQDKWCKLGLRLLSEIRIRSGSGLRLLSEIRI